MRMWLIEKMIDLKTMTKEEVAKRLKSNVAFYGMLYQDYDIRDFNGLPIVTKSVIKNTAKRNPMAFLDQFCLDASHYAETSGSTGVPTPVFYSKGEIAKLVRFMSIISPCVGKIRKTIKETGNRVAINGLTFGYTIAGFAMGELLQSIGFITAQLGSRSTIGTPVRTAATIVKLKPLMIAATATDFLSWMQIIKEDHPNEYNNVVNSLKFFLNTAEPCADSRLRQIEKLFGVIGINLYASVDGMISIPCLCGEKHLLPTHYIELFDERMNHLGEYGTGRLCYTTLLKSRTTPMCRWLLDDWVTVKKSDCPYGFRKSIDPHGRFELTVSNKGDRYGILHFEEQIFQYGLFMDYRIRVFEDHIEIEIEPYPQFQTDFNKALFAEIMDLPVVINFVNFGDMNKYREVRKEKSILKIEDLRPGAKAHGITVL